MKTTNIPALILEGAQIKARIEADGKRLKEISATLTAELAAGKHEGAEGSSVSVVDPAASIKPTKDDAEAVRAIVAPDVFGKLFDRVVSFAPVKAFREVLAAITDKRTQKKVLALCEKQGSAYVKF